MKKGFWLALLLCVVVPTSLLAATKELDTAVAWLHQNGLTQYTNASTFKANQSIRRDEASKFFSVFANSILQRPAMATNQNCTRFPDLVKPNTMKTYIYDTCTRGYILGINGNFSPSSSLTNAQAIAIIIRMLEGKKDESGPNRATEYYRSAQTLGLLSGLDLLNPTLSITRGKLGILLYRVGQLSDIATYIQQNNIDIASTNKPDFEITSVGLDPAYPSPKVGDEAPYLKVTVKNIGASTVLTSATKVVVTCGSSIRKEITNWTFGANQDITIAGLTNTPGTHPNMFPEAKSYAISCNVQLQSSSIYESNENNNSTSFTVTVGAASTVIAPSTGAQGFDLIIDHMNIYGNAPSLYDNKFYTQTVIKNIGNTNFLGDITFICEDYSTAEGQTLLTQHLNGTSIPAGGSFTFNSEGLFSNFYNRSASKTMSCVAGVSNDDNPRNNSYAFSFDTIEKNAGTGDLSLVVTDVDRVNKKMVFTVSNIGSGPIPGSQVLCLLNGEFPPINGIQNISISFQGDRTMLAPGASYTETFDLSQYTYDDIDELVCSVGSETNFLEVSKSNNTVTLHYKTD